MTNHLGARRNEHEDQTHQRSPTNLFPASGKEGTVLLGGEGGEGKGRGGSGGDPQQGGEKTVPKTSAKVLVRRHA